jgi:hypothetical protein
VLHRSQIATLLGLSVEDEGKAPALARDCAGILAAWVGHLAELPFGVLVAATQSRGRSLRNLTVNVFHPFELLVETPTTGRFDWDPDRDGEREAQLADADAVRRYADRIKGAWKTFVRDGAECDARCEIATSRGPIGWANLLASQRWHAAYHYRQLTSFLAETGRPVAHPFPLVGLAGLDLPADVY